MTSYARNPTPEGVEWLKRYRAQLIKDGLDPLEASAIEPHVDLSESPEDAADEEIAYLCESE